MPAEVIGLEGLPGSRRHLPGGFRYFQSQADCRLREAKARDVAMAKGAQLQRSIHSASSSKKAS